MQNSPWHPAGILHRYGGRLKAGPGDVPKVFPVPAMLLTVFSAPVLVHLGIVRLMDGRRRSGGSTAFPGGLGGG